ncbi:Lens fiber membrane intrinsic protein [Mactra antiquata]
MAFNTSSIWIKVGFICLILGTILFVIGFATTAWMVIDSYRGHSDEYGLWRHKSCPYIGTCTSQKITERWLDSWTSRDSYRATRAFESIGLGCQLLALFIMILFVFVDRAKRRSPLIAIVVFCIVGAVCMAIGFVIFAMEFDRRDVGWSMGVAIAGCVLTFVAGIMGILELKG